MRALSADLKAVEARNRNTPQSVLQKGAGHTRMTHDYRAFAGGVKCFMECRSGGAMRSVFPALRKCGRWS